MVKIVTACILLWLILHFRFSNIDAQLDADAVINRLQENLPFHKRILRDHASITYVYINPFNGVHPLSLRLGYRLRSGSGIDYRGEFVLHARLILDSQSYRLYLKDDETQITEVEHKQTLVLLGKHFLQSAPLYHLKKNGPLAKQKQIYIDSVERNEKRIHIKLKYYNRDLDIV